MLEALYSKFYKDWLEEDSDTYQQTYELSLFDILDDNNVTETNARKLIEMLKLKYSYWEICEDDNDTFLILLTNKILAYRDYYQEIIDAYNTQINFLDGKKTVVTREDDSNGSGSSSGSNSSTGKGYELPNKTINDGLGNLSNANTSTGENENESSYEDHSEGTLTTIGDVDVVDAKRRYLDLIRNIYAEWASKCEDCFLGIFN